MRPVLHLDTETYSACDLKKAGLYRYAEDPSTDLICACYQFDDGPVHLWVPIELPTEFGIKLRDEWLKKFGGVVYHGPGIPNDLREHIEAGHTVVAHNHSFERRGFSGTYGKRYKLPEISIKQGKCTMAKARVHGLPGALDDGCAVLGIPGKDKAGQNAMRKLCKPNSKGQRITFEMEPELHWECYFYCGDDVRAEHRLDLNVPDLTPAEQKVWELDQRINDRGWLVDSPRVQDAVHLVTEYKKTLADKVREITKDVITLIKGQKKVGLDPTQTGALAEWIRAHGYPQLEDLQVGTVNEVVKDPGCPDEIKKLLRIFSTHNMKAVTKFAPMLLAQCLDGCLRGMFLFYGASTGRWASLIVQLQNMLRPLIKDPDLAIEHMKARSLERYRWMWSEIDPMKIFASCTRGMLIAHKGFHLIALDFSQIEARLVAWLADAFDILDVFASGQDVYVFTAAKIYGMTIAAVLAKGKDCFERFIGKIAVLALGYQGGEAAFAKMAKNFNVDIDPNFARKIKEDWRNANPKIVQLWYDIERAAVAAVADPGRIYGCSRNRLMFKVVDRWLYMRLPSGRRLAYFMPALNADGQVTYLGIDTYTRQWGRVKTYGGKLLQNACEGIARDLLVAGVQDLESVGYPPIGTVHDEGIFEVPEGFGSLDEAKQIITRKRAWAEGLPVGVEGWRGPRYGKR